MALGDYIHYRRVNYLKYGVGYKNNKAYSGNGAVRYLIQKRQKGIGNIQGTIKALEQELQKNNAAAMNSDWGNDTQEIKQLKAEFEAKCIAIFESGQASTTGLRSGSKYYDLGQLEGQYDAYNQLLAEVDAVNMSAAAGHGISEARLGELLTKYRALENTVGGTRKSILGKIQQGLNQYAAQVWHFTLVGGLGRALARNADVISEKVGITAVNKAIREAVTQGQVKDAQTNAAATSYNGTDAVGSTYSVIPSENGITFNYNINRPFVLNDRNKKGMQVNKTVIWRGQQINLGAILTELDTNGQFATHWLNRHSINRLNSGDNGLDESLRKAIIVEAYSQSREVGDAIVSIDREAGRIDYKTLNDLLTSDLALVSIHEPIENIRFDNRWVGQEARNQMDAYERAQGIAAQTHGMMLNISANLTL